MSEYTFSSNVPNDVIDVYAKPDIKVKSLKPKYSDELRVQLEGKSVDNSVVNALRRTAMEWVAVYGVHRSNCYIDHKKCKYMYNNDFMYNLLETLPFYDIDNDFDLENPELYLQTPELRSAFPAFIQDRPTDEEIIPYIPKRTKKVEITIGYKNNSNEDHFVSTHDIILRIDGAVSDSYKKHDHVCICVIKPGEEINLRAEATLGIAKIHAIWEACTQAFHEEITPMKYILYYETLGQLHQLDIFRKSTVILIKQLQSLYEYNKKHVKDEGGKQFREEYKGLDHTIGNLLATTLQKCTLVRSAAYTMDHLFINTVVVEFIIQDTTKIGTVQVLLDTISYLIKVFQAIDKSKLD